MTERPPSDEAQENLPSDRSRADEEGTSGGGAPFDWSSLVAQLVHPTKVMIVEALSWIGEPLSPTDLARMASGEDQRDHYLSLVAYHLATLANAGVVEVVRTRPARGALERFYFFRQRRARAPSGGTSVGRG